MMADETLRSFSCATIYEAAGGSGAMTTAIKPVWPGARLVGRARTVRTMAGDNLALHVILPDLQPGDVLVVDAGAETAIAVWGDVMTHAALAVGAVGLVVDGAVRDSAAIAAMVFPVFARSVTIPGPSKQQLGATDVPILCGGVRVAPGDWVVGDADGVVVVPNDQIPAVLAAAAAREAREHAMIARLQSRRTTTIEELGLAALVGRRTEAPS
jgi:4-hydroxy-4-methyl-2-oxoglutarate aldolase